ncbi:MAG TPA: tripartite tricarboxylate transporter substrate binding protein [Burkholderiales bacterium]|nr:tripartite tricarboxylate transporter substrate binding protein [Burkholderiales bacterium]
MLRRLIVLVTCALLALPIFAQDYPKRPVRLIVPFPPGGGNDIVARAVAQELAKSLGQQFVVDNRAGAGGAIGAELAARSPADGYTLFLGGVGSHVVNPSLHAKLSYDPIRDFAPVTLIASAPSVLVVNPSLQATNVAEFTALAKANPGKLNYASNGNGSSAQLAAVLYESMAGVRMMHVPYKGVAAALVDVMSGEVQLMFGTLVAIIPHIKAGRLRALAVTGKRRSALLPDVPTLAESGLPGYEAGSWYGILAPAGTSGAIVARLNAEINNAIRQPEVRERLAAEGAEVLGGTPDDFASHMNAELSRMKKLVRESGIRME